MTTTALQPKIPVCAIVGPTASGKTDLAVAIAKKNNGEIISFDSMQIYKEAPIATAVPTMEERCGIPHHLMEFVSADETFSVARYTALAHETILQVHEKGKLPVLVGGTGLYYSSLLDNLQFAPQNQDNSKLRLQLKQRLDTEGIESLYGQLQEVDPEAAQNIHINNHVRVLRALEVYLSTGKTMTQQAESSRSVPSPYEPCVIGLNYRNRELLYERINLRVEKMLAAGLEREVRAIYETNPTGTLMQAIGVKEFIPYFKQEISLEQVIDTIQRESRRYAKRQLTWFRRDPRVHWLYRDDVESSSQLLDMAQQIINEHF
jgi:tRNA dimethylallyltransferase